MTREEAWKLFENLEDEDDRLDLYEEQLFDYKKFFLSKAPIAKLYEGRLRKLRQLEEAFRLVSSSEHGPGDMPTGDLLSGQRMKRILPLGPPPKGEEVSILDTFQAFQKEKNELKRLISNAGSAEALAGLAESLVALEKQNAAQWSIALESEEDIIVSKEPDPMYLLQAIQAYREQGGETFGQLKNLENNPPGLLVQEMKRLSLLFKKF